LIGLFEDLGGYLNLIFYIYTKNDLSSNKSEDPVGKLGVVVVFSIFYGTTVTGFGDSFRIFIRISWDFNLSAERGLTEPARFLFNLGVEFDFLSSLS